MKSSLKRLRAQAINQTLFPLTTLPSAVKSLGFVQADPIRSPATAQDLILRQRVKEYRVGDLDRNYQSLDIEEDMFYAYGFLPRTSWRLLHPRTAKKLPKLSQQIYEAVRELGPIHPKQLQDQFGGERVTNAWGGYSKATTMILDELHYLGLLRIARREKGVRIYEASSVSHEPVSAEARAQKLALIVAKILSPAPQRSLQETLGRVWHSMPEPVDTKAILDQLFRSGDLQKEIIDDIGWVTESSKDVFHEPPKVVRFLAPFDPVVWDRRRFELLWGWSYRFEAYTPVAKRVRGYYSLPLLWIDEIIGWANLSVEEKKLKLDLGFVDRPPKSQEFRSALNQEIEQFENFLDLKNLKR